MKQKPPRWVQITAAVLRRYLALDMTVYAGSATLFLLTASFPLLMWVLIWSERSKSEFRKTIRVTRLLSLTMLEIT